jgi:hypothetical protein
MVSGVSAQEPIIQFNMGLCRVRPTDAAAWSRRIQAVGQDSIYSVPDLHYIGRIHRQSKVIAPDDSPNFTMMSRQHGDPIFTA